MYKLNERIVRVLSALLLSLILITLSAKYGLAGFLPIYVYVFSSLLLSSFNHIGAIVYLICVFTFFGLVLFTKGIKFIGLTMITVYVGGVLLLFLSALKFVYSGYRLGAGITEDEELENVLLVVQVLFVLSVLTVISKTGLAVFSIVIN